MKREDEKVIQQLQRDWQKVDDLSQDVTTSRFEASQQVQLFVKEKRKRLVKELLLFLLTAVVLLSTISILFLQSQKLFLVIQALVFFMAVVIVFYLFKKEKGKEGQWVE
ncbi:DUF5345 family protein [Alkalihalobacillus pseudalcaliphilus]|uniref:DUF5345 family protein n=1 Tax=Alkalihalobacillus pseudalcaliphilus TaxID=79884 RepID=UPI00064E0894|nr:DUF5345 family protein [Alkalihalobacillus pseudalcaliphilus]KMK75591.1 hypothetical protein AB990_09895 [Alkalihalobacillus pseudalcaliphilus]